jgi:hypothetical protein
MDDILNYIPKEEVERLFKKNYRMAGNLCEEFMGFTRVYKNLLPIIPKHFTIIDFGCCYGAQCYYFKDYNLYIGVDTLEEERFKTDNTIHYRMTIQEFIKMELPMLHLDKTRCFAISSYVPDDEANQLIRETFPNLMVFYPS